MNRSIMAALAALVVPASLHAIPADFEDLPLGNPGIDGSTQYGTTGTYYWNGSDNAASFSSGGVTLPNTFTDWRPNYDYTSWDGFAYSNMVDTTTAGFGNQYSSFPGGGAGGSSKYVVGYQPYVGNWAITLDADYDFTGRGMFVTNTTYAALDMLGFGYSKKFGGDSGDDPDYLKLTIEGYLNEALTGTTEFYLADYRFSNNSQDYIIDEWTWVNLGSLGTIDELRFVMDSTDSGTPTYFAMDNVGAVPEPGTCGLLLVGAAFFLRKKAARRHARAH